MGGGGFLGESPGLLLLIEFSPRECSRWRLIGTSTDAPSVTRRWSSGAHSYEPLMPRRLILPRGSERCSSGAEWRKQDLEPYA